MIGLLLPLASIAQATLFCRTSSQPNPIVAEYPGLTTGTINGTVAVIPIPLSYARSIIPAKYPLLTGQLYSLLPWFPQDKFPLMMQTEIDHDIQTNNIPIADFSRGGFSFPFVDRLNDGYTAMAYQRVIALSALNLPAEAGTASYGDKIVPGTFDPPCDAYECADAECESKSFKVYDSLALLSGPILSHNFTASQGSPYPISFYKNITNQPQFSDDKLVCDNYIRLYNSSITTGQFAPVHVTGTVDVQTPLLPEDVTYEDVWGVQMDNAFIENNYVACDSLKGYTFAD